MDRNSSVFTRNARTCLAVGLVAVAVVNVSMPAHAEPASCLDPDMSKWPAPSKPYFMLIVDNSGSMTSGVGTGSSCNYSRNTDRLAHARCAVRNTVQAFSGEVNFGLSTYAWRLNCTGAEANCSSCGSGYCFSSGGCGVQISANDHNACGPRIAEPTLGINVHSGANVVVPMLQDHYWLDPPDPTNVPSILGLVDNRCGTGNIEIGAWSNTPMGGSLFNMHQYFSGTYQNIFTGATLASPIGPAASERSCRSINVVLITDGDETCDYSLNSGTYPNGEGLAVYEAGRLYNPGVTVNGQNFRIKTHVIGFAGATKVALDHIAAAGGTTTSFSTANEAELSQALATIVGNSVRPEVCDNTDNNCNGCTDEGYTHYCDIQPTAGNCCTWSTPAQRTTCLTNYQASITPANPKGDLSLLPCTTLAQSNDPATWLCYDPGERCDDTDNNCKSGVDEGFNKCGSPLHCPRTETCNNEDDDCDTSIDEGVCGGCTPSPEVCDGCDNDCDGTADDGVAPLACGQPTPANCQGQLICRPSQPVATPGGCVSGGGFLPCNNNPQTEVCDGQDNNCDGIPDNSIASVDCEPTGTPAGLVYGPNSQCVKGRTACIGGVTVCQGFVGPSSEVCDGVDNNCDGQVDNSVPGVGQNCGISQPPCTPGKSACVNGAMVCQGGTQPQAEVCDGVDNNCDGKTDEAPLADSPGAGLGGCWTEPGTCCSFASLHWCPPTDATCNGNGSLDPPCNVGALTCVLGGWQCLNAKAPSPEACDNIDNNCDGQVDNGISQVGQTCGTNEGECTAGIWQCSNGVLSCPGGVGGSAEQCDGKDNDCDGQTDNNIQGLGVACGNSIPPCAPGLTACIGGKIVCSGGHQPQAESCNNIDDNCDGLTDNPPLVDAPAPGESGCWTVAGSCCSFQNLSWCPPPGGDCHTTGTLTMPCSAGALMCSAGAWACNNPVNPGVEVCDGMDNNCDGVADNVTPVDCVPDGTDPNLAYGPTSQCKMGTRMCGLCAGFVGPSKEICDGIDNDCNGTPDDNPTGIGAVCGVGIKPCEPGLTACVNGALACVGGVSPQPEVCDGIDNNCNGSTDEAPLADSPPPGEGGCWPQQGDCGCTFLNFSWCPPAGAGCRDNGTLGLPCNKGYLACNGAAGWTCLNAKLPGPEVCDAIDNNCDGTTDEPPLPNTGQVCGSDEGECKEGKMGCKDGILSCVGGATPTNEICDGLDNNCDGKTDNGIPVGDPCAAPYDEIKYPGQRTFGSCQPGLSECDGKGGLICVGGIGPQPEVCDGIDNDCDGQSDESGPGPDGIDATQNPQAEPNAKIGDECGTSTGTCAAGKWGCLNGIFACIGSQGPQPETCDCEDDDCNNVVDNENGDGGPPLCSPGKQCIKVGQNCQCAAPCSSGEFVCGGGQKCEAAVSSSTGEPLGNFCITAVDLCQGDCSKKTVKDAKDKTICAPAGTDPAGCYNTPVCVCHEQSGCGEPCAGKECGVGQVCTNFGPNAGKCVVNKCYETGCQGCNKACHLGDCVGNPCKEGTCPAGQTCKPKNNFTAYDCVKSCAGMTCDTGKTCLDGSCVETCNPACASGTVCDQTTKKCVANKCSVEGGTKTCSDGACCDPLTGNCGDCPCEGIVCPSSQKCEAGQCLQGTGGAGGSSGGGAGGSGGKGGSAGTSDAGGDTGGKAGSGGPPIGPQQEEPNGAFGLATGGGGCACRVGIDRSNAGRAALLVLLGLGLMLRRRSGSESRRAS